MGGTEGREGREGGVEKCVGVRKEMEELGMCGEKTKRENEEER